MKARLVLGFFLFVFIAGLIFMACTGDDDDDSNENDDSADDDAVEELWEDPTSGLMWSNFVREYESLDGGKSYCQDLFLADYGDWRLPTISELRSLIRGCEDTETGGSCGVTDSCLDLSCWELHDCYGCPYGDRPAWGCYWPSQLQGTCGEWFWSSSAVADDDFFVWSVDFLFGKVAYYGVDYDIFNARCVR